MTTPATTETGTVTTIVIGIAMTIVIGTVMTGATKIGARAIGTIMPTAAVLSTFAKRL